MTSTKQTDIDTQTQDTCLVHIGSTKQTDITKRPHQEDTGVAHGWPKSSYVVSKIGWSALSRIQQREMGDDPRDDIVVSGNLDHDRFFFIFNPGWKPIIDRFQVNHVHPGWVATDLGGAKEANFIKRNKECEH